MDGDRESIKIGDHKIWEQRWARLEALESVNETQLQPESKYRVYLLLCTAMKEGNVDEFIEALEKCSAEERVSLSAIIGIQGPSGNSLLHVAAGIWKPDILQTLLEFFYDMPLTPKVKKQYLRDPWKVVKYRRDAAKVNYQGDTALHIAARAGRIHAAELLLDCVSIEGKANDMGNTALHEAVKNRHSELTSMLLSKNPTLVYKQNKESKCPLYLAVEMGNLEILRLLMEPVDGHEVLPSRIEGMSPVHGAVIHRRKEKYNHERAKFPDAWSRALHKFIRFLLSNDVEMMKEMSERNKELFNLRDAGGGTPLHLAVYVNYVDGVEFLVNKFASSAFEGDRNGYLPIHVACMMGHLEIIKKLLRLWPNPDELLNLQQGQNILHVAAKYGKDLVVDYILRDPKLQKLINAKDKGGNTPLHLAASHLQFKALLSFTGEDAVDLELVNNRNLTAFDIADERQKQIFARRTAFRLLAVPLLKAVKAPRSKDKAICRPEGLYQGRDVEPLHLRRPKEAANTCMVVATLVAAMTFAVGFSVRGGYNSSEPDAGIAMLLYKPVYDVFVICNTVAMYSSIFAIVILLKTQPNGFRPVHHFLLKARLPLLIAIATMSAAFMAGVYVIVSNRPWVAVVALIIGITALFHIFRFYSYLILWPLFYFLKLTVRLARLLPFEIFEGLEEPLPNISK